MNGIVAVTSNINARLTATLTRLALPIPTFRFGQDELYTQDAPPRIVWVPKRGPADGKLKPAADHPSQFSGDPTDHTPVNPRPLWRRRVGFEAHVWALRDNATVDLAREKDYTAAEVLANHLVAAIHDEMYGSYAVTSEDWSTQQASKQRLGAVVVVGVELEMAWAREDDAYRVVTAMPIAVGSAH